MKKGLLCILIVFSGLLFCSCAHEEGYTDSRDDKTERYLELADSNLAVGEVEKALSFLHEGYLKTGSEELLRRLNEISEEHGKTEESAKDEVKQDVTTLPKPQESQEPQAPLESQEPPQPTQDKQEYYSPARICQMLESLANVEYGSSSSRGEFSISENDANDVTDEGASYKLVLHYQRYDPSYGGWVNLYNIVLRVNKETGELADISSGETVAVGYLWGENASIELIRPDPYIISSVTKSDRWLYPRPERVLQRGSQGEDVKYIQAMLAAMNYDGVVVDGDFGPVTESALMRWQANHRYEINGIVDEWTLSCMEDAETIWRNRK